MKDNKKAMKRRVKVKSINFQFLLSLSFLLFPFFLLQHVRRKLDNQKIWFFFVQKKGEKRKKRQKKWKKSSRIISNVQWGLQFFYPLVFFLSSRSLSMWFFRVIGAKFSTWKCFFFLFVSNENIIWYKHGELEGRIERAKASRWESRRRRKRFTSWKAHENFMTKRFPNVHWIKGDQKAISHSKWKPSQGGN